MLPANVQSFTLPYKKGYSLIKTDPVVIKQHVEGQHLLRRQSAVLQGKNVHNMFESKIAMTSAHYWSDIAYYNLKMSSCIRFCDNYELLEWNINISPGTIHQLLPFNL